MSEIIEKSGVGGAPRIQIRTPFSECKLESYGAHITHFQPLGKQPVLFMSQASRFEAGQPIRGGIPVIFPWFGQRAFDPQLPIHGFARLLPWSIETVHTNIDGSVRVEMQLPSSDATRAQWPFEFIARLEVLVADDLQVTMEIRNYSASEMHFEQALHTYLAVEDIRKVSVTGLEDCHYLDKTEGFARKLQGEEPIIFGGETDRIYLNTFSPVVVRDPQRQRVITVDKEGSSSTVVWNPWINKARAMTDFGDEEWPAMLCVETANVAENVIALRPGETHSMTARYALGDGQR